VRPKPSPTQRPVDQWPNGALRLVPPLPGDPGDAALERALLRLVEEEEEEELLFAADGGVEADVEVEVEVDVDFDVDIAVEDPAEALRRDVYHGLVHCIVSNQALWSTVDVARLPALLEPALQALPSSPLSLEPLWIHMVIERRTPRAAAAETLLLFHSRAARWGITMTLPAELSRLRPGQRARAVEGLRSRGGSTGTHVGPAPRRAAPKPAPKPAPKSSSSSSSSSWTLARLVRYGLRAAFAASLVVAFQLLPRHDPEAARVEARLQNVCDTVVVSGRVALCTVEADDTAIAIALDRADAVDAGWSGEVIVVGPDGPVSR
jgi:hypothetical protein